MATTSAQVVGAFDGALAEIGPSLIDSWLMCLRYELCDNGIRDSYAGVMAAKRDLHDRSRTGKAALALASVLGASFLSVPAAQARPTCQGTDVQTTCETSGSVSIKVRPGTAAPPANLPVYPWLGAPVPGAD